MKMVLLPNIYVFLPLTRYHYQMIFDDMGAILDPLGECSYAALSFDLVGEDVLITGAGPIGIMAAAVARHAARHVVITDVNPNVLCLLNRWLMWWG